MEMRFHFTILIILFSSNAWAQKYLIETRVQKIVYRGDSLVYEIPKTFETRTKQATPIIEIGRIGDNVFGVQIELIESKLKEEGRFISGRIYYIKKGKNPDWEVLLTSIYQQVRVEDLKARVKEEVRQKRIMEEKDSVVRKMYLTTDSDSMDGFGVYYYNYFFKAK